MGRRRKASAETGTATVEFVGLLPALLLATLIAAQLLLVGFSLWSASISARAGARAAHVGADPLLAARRAIPRPMRDAGEFDRKGGAVVARVAVPRVLPILPVVRVEARSALGMRR